MVLSRYALAIVTGLSASEAARIQKRRRGAGTVAQQDCYAKYDGQPLVQLNAMTEAELNEMSSAVRALSCTEAGEDDFKELMAICSPASALELKEKYGEKLEMIEKDAGGFYRQTSGVSLSHTFSAEGGLSTSDDFYTTWRDYDARLGRVQALVNASDGTASFEQIGQSIEGRPIYLVRVRGAGFEAGGPRVLANFQQHAREWIAGMTGVYAVEQAIAKAKEDPSWLAGAELLLVPLSNPDGIVYSETSDRMWRKNRRDIEGSRCKGVDMNRNWLPAWEASRDYCGEIYGGTAAFSEPETQALRKVIDEAQTTLHLDVHAYSELIIAPYGFTRTPHPRRALLDVPGLAIQQAIKDIHGREYKYGGSEILYGSKGVARDYLSSGNGFGWTIELRPTRNGRGGFAPPADQIVPTAEEFTAGLYAAIAWAKAPVSTPEPPTPAPTPAPCSWTCRSFGCGWGSCRDECWTCAE